MESEPTKEEVQDRLHETAEALSDRLGSLEEEFASSGSSIREWVVENPWKSVGGMLVAGVAVGFLFGGSGSDRRPAHDELLDRYIDALRREVEEAVAAGESPGQALERALRDRAPLVVYGGGEESETRSRGSFVGRSIGFVARTVFREVVRDFILSMFEGGAVEEMMDEEPIE